MFSNASNYVHGVDYAFAVILGISLFFLITLTGAMIYFVIKFNKKKHPKAVQIKDSTWLEITWTTIPLILVLFMFYIGWQGFIPMRNSPSDAMHVNVIGKMWKWSFQYDGNKMSDTLVLPINKSVKLDLISKDVIHGFSIPSFRMKEDAVPGNKNYTWFIPGQLGDFDIFCSAYCGLDHSYMHTIVRILPQDEFDSWLANLPTQEMKDNPGLKLVEKNGCTACHSLDGSRVVGPSFKGIYGTSIDVLTNGKKRKVMVDSLYIKSSITDPDKDIADTYSAGIMKTYKGVLNDKDIQQINEYLKSLK